MDNNSILAGLKPLYEREKELDKIISDASTERSGLLKAAIDIIGVKVGDDAWLDEQIRKGVAL